MEPYHNPNSYRLNHYHDLIGILEESDFLTFTYLDPLLTVT